MKKVLLLACIFSCFAFGAEMKMDANTTELNATNEIAFGAPAIIKAINPANDSCEDECQSSCSDQCRNDDDPGACEDVCVSGYLKYQYGK